jgi:two-component sensor histidine kinase
MNIPTSGERPETSAQTGNNLSPPSGHTVNAVSGSRPLRHDVLSNAMRYGAHGTQSKTDHSTPMSQFEEIASAAAGLSSQRLRLLGILLGSASPASCGGRPALRPIWMTEALRRAHNLVRLVERLDRRTPISDDQSRLAAVETSVGIELASIFESLTITDDEELRPCSRPLRDVTRNLIELFGPSAGDISAATCIGRLVLPAFRHRALILIASELVMNALLHAFNDERTGRVTLQLATLDPTSARMTVTDDGDRLFDRARNDYSRWSVIDYLADLLQSDIIYRSRGAGGTNAEIVFPIS